MPSQENSSNEAFQKTPLEILSLICNKEIDLTNESSSSSSSNKASKKRKSSSSTSSNQFKRHKKICKSCSTLKKIRNTKINQIRTARILKEKTPTLENIRDTQFCLYNILSLFSNEQLIKDIDLCKFLNKNLARIFKLLKHIDETVVLSGNSNLSISAHMDKSVAKIGNILNNHSHHIMMIKSLVSSVESLVAVSNKKHQLEMKKLKEQYERIFKQNKQILKLLEENKN